MGNVLKIKSKVFLAIEKGNYIQADVVDNTINSSKLYLWTTQTIFGSRLEHISNDLSCTLTERKVMPGYCDIWKNNFIRILPVLGRGRIAGTGRTKPGGGTGDPGDHPRCRFFGGPEVVTDAMLKKTNRRQQSFFKFKSEKKLNPCLVLLTPKKQKCVCTVKVLWIYNI